MNFTFTNTVNDPKISEIILHVFLQIEIPKIQIFMIYNSQSTVINKK